MKTITYASGTVFPYENLTIIGQSYLAIEVILLQILIGAVNLPKEANTEACDVQQAKKDPTWQVCLWLIALLPFVQALLSWDLDGNLDGVQYAIRHLSIPAITAEIIVVAYALKFGTANSAALSAFPKPIVILIIAWFCIAIAASLFQYENRLLSVISLSRYILHGLFFIAIVQIISNSNFFEIKYWLLIISIGITFYVMAQFIFAVMVPDPVNFPWITRMPSATNIRQIANIVAIPSGAAISLILFSRTNKKYFGAAILFCAVLFIAWSGSRTALMAIFVSTFASLILVRKLPEIKSLALFVTSFVIGLGTSILLPNPSSMFGLLRIVDKMQDAEDLSSGRVQLWVDTANEISKHPLLGFGSGRFRGNMNEIYGASLNHPHNFILQFSYDWGVFGAATVLILLSYLLWIIWKKAPSDPLTGFAAASGFLTLCSISMVDGAFFYPLTIIASIMLIAPLLAVTNKNSRLEKS